MSDVNLLEGIIPPMITPFDEKGSIDKESTRNIVDYLIEGGVHTLFILGTTGEGPLISIGEQVELAQTVVEHTASRVPVIAGISDTSSKKVLNIIDKLTPTGLDAFVSTLPFYDNTNIDEQVKHFEYLAAKSDRPIIIYDIPAKVGQRLDEISLEKLIENDNIIGLKDSSSNIRKFRERVEKFSEKDDFSFALGHSDMIDISLYLGAKGVVPSDAHLFPKLCVDIYDSAVNEDWKKAKSLQSELNSKRISLYSEYPKNSRANNKVCKKWLKEKGVITSDHVMQPYL